jgi:hypothetical protein
VEEIAPTMSAIARSGREGQRLPPAEGDKKVSSKISRLQDRRFDQQRENKPECTSLRVSDMISADLLPDLSSLDRDDDDHEFQEAIRRSLLESSSSATESMTAAHLKKACGVPLTPSVRTEEKSVNLVAKKGTLRTPQAASKKTSNQTLNSLKKKQDLSVATAPPPSLLSETGKLEPQRCLICDELFDSEERLYAFGCCDHALICGVRLFLFFLLLNLVNRFAPFDQDVFFATTIA